MNAELSRTPTELRVVEDLCNSAILLHDVDAFATVGGGYEWLTRNGWDFVPTDAHLVQLRAEREIIRAFLVDRADPGARAALNQLVQKHWGAAKIDTDGQLGLVATGDTISPSGAAVSALLLHGLTASGRRLKTCASEACRYVFYDSSRSRTRTWCDMNVCGARNKMRHYRTRLDEV